LPAQRQPAQGIRTAARSRASTRSNRSQVGDRATQAGFNWRRIGENIVAGQGSPKQAVPAWLGSPGYCANIMNRNFTEMGAAYAVNPESDITIYWTQLFGRSR